MVASGCSVMKTFVMLACLLGAARCGDYPSDFKCAGTPSSMKFVLKSYRNQTGHWTAQVQLEHTDVEDAAVPWEVEVDHTLAPRCDGTGAVLIVATITAPSRGNGIVKTQPQKRIPEGYKKLSDSHYYRSNPEARTWVDARDICEKEGAHLAIMNSETEAKFISSLWSSNSEWAFIGTHDLYVEGKYVTLHNETLRDAGYDSWYSGEPNGGIGENCGVINRNTLLGNYFCNRPLPFFCELQK